MTPYQIMIEGVFVHAPELGGVAGGFHTTFFLKANNAANAVNRVRTLLADRMSSHGVTRNEGGLLGTYYWVHDLWEITEERLPKGEDKDSGFTFFHIGKYERFYLAFRHAFFQRFKPWLLIAQVV